MTISEKVFIKNLITSLNDGTADIQTDDHRQLIVYTGMFQWLDDSIHDRPEIDLKDKRK